MPPSLPRKTAGLQETSSGTDLLVTDPTGRELLVLNREATLVFSLCNGAHDEAQIAEVLAEIHPEVPPGQVLEDVRTCLEQFRRAGLLEGASPARVPGDDQSP